MVSGRLTRIFGGLLAVLCAIAVMVVSSDGLAAKKKPRKKAKAPAAASKAPAPVIQPLSDPAPAPVAAPAPAPAPAAPVETGPLSIAIIIEGTNARDLDTSLKKAFADQVAIAVPSAVRAAVSPADQRVIGRPTKQSDLVKVSKRVAKKAGVDALVYANVGGSASSGYTAAVLMVHRSGRVLVDGSVPVTRVVKRGGRATLSWQLANVSAMVQPGIDDLKTMPRSGTPGPGKAPSTGSGMSLSDALANFESNRGAGGAAPGPVSSSSEDNDKPEDAEGGSGEEIVAVVEESGPREHVFERRFHSPVMLKIGIEGQHRNFAYNQPITANLRDYSVGMAPLALIEAEAYPFANANVAVLKNIGWYASYARAFGVQSSFRTVTADSDVKVSNDWSTWQVGLHSRWRLARKLGLGAQLTYGFSNYRFNFADLADSRAFEVPEVRYGFLRYGLEVRVPVSFLEVSGGAGYRSIMSGGRVTSSYFPNSQAGGVDVYGTLTLAISKAFSLDGTVRYTRYFYDMKPEVGDTYVAGGALDQYLGMSLSLVYLMGGSGQ